MIKYKLSYKKINLQKLNSNMIKYNLIIYKRYINNVLNNQKNKMNYQ